MNDNELRCWLLQAGFKASEPLQVSINDTTGNAFTPLMIAAKLGELDIIRALLDHGADVSLLNTDNNGALWFACFSNSEPCVAALIQAGVLLDSQNVNGATSLIYCASAGKTALVSMLIEAGADTGLMTLDDFTALELAANRECLKLLKSAIRKQA